MLKHGRLVVALALLAASVLVAGVGQALADGLGGQSVAGAPGAAVAKLGSISPEELLGRKMPPVPPKPQVDLPPPPETPRIQGDTVDDPFLVSGLPFSATGSTCGFNNDYDYACPYAGSVAPDVVYAWTADADLGIDIDLCGSVYDTKVYVYGNAVGIPIACNDDYCNWQSYLANVPVVSGNTYYIVVDGYGVSCGTYELQIHEYVPCVVECPPGATPEGEPDCYDGYDDVYNGGCNVDPFPVFQEIEPACDPIVICGTTGVFMVDDEVYRDTDWFELNVTDAALICIGGEAEVPALFSILDGRGGCWGSIEVWEPLEPCQVESDICPPYSTWQGAWWVVVVPHALEMPCGSVYWLEIVGYTNGASPASETTWGRVKGLFR